MANAAAAPARCPDPMTHDGYREAKKKLDEQYALLAKEEAEESEVQSEIRSLGDGTSADELDQGAAALLAGAEAAAVTHASDLRLELAEIRKRIALRRRAVEIQKELVRGAEADAANAFAEKLEPKFREVVEKMAEAAIAFGRAAEEEQAARESFRDHGLNIPTSVLRPMPFYGLGNPRERDSNLARWLREAVEYKFISRRMIPADWLDAWGER